MQAEETDTLDLDTSGFDESLSEPVAATPGPSVATPAPSAKPPAPPVAVPTRGGSRRGLMIVAGAAAVVVFLAVGMRAARGPAGEPAAAPAVTHAAPPTTPVRPPGAPVAPSAKTLPPPPPVVPKWSTEKQATWLGARRRGAAFELPADNVVKTWFGPARPSLVVRCVSRNLEVFVFTGSPMKIETREAGKTVNLAMDDEPMRTERWPDSDDHDALFAPDPVGFTRRLLTARTLRFSYSPHNSNDVVAEFSLAGLDAMLTAASRECRQ